MDSRLARRAARIPVALALAFASAAAAPARHPAPLPGAARPGPGAPVAVDARVSVAGDETRLVVDLSAGVAVEASLTEEPDRLVLDLPEVNFQVDPAAGRLGAGGVGLVRGFRFGLFAPGRSRVVVDLDGPAALRRAEVASIAGGSASRLTVALAPTDRAAFHAAVRRPAPEPAAAAPPPTSDPRPVVVIDPGHGGVDPGAGGLGGAVEKEVVLQFALALSDRLSAGGRYRVVMTRHDDRFVSLGDRVRVARDAGAALLISVHADTLKDAAVAGATVYTAADRASDPEAARVAAAENQSDAAAGIDDAPRAAADVSDILDDLTRRETRADSHRFQRTLTGYWAKIARLNHNPERSAGFKVLQAPDVPSVLLELGYLSSGQDARSLASPDWRAKAAAGVAASVDAFFAAPVAAAPPAPSAMR
ncbi:N-acetylmuramoyl-L-alanine amidase [Lichenibacterium dinghuense]|uniref:N-acetylmuramoyl-L-alanine amidase n=1 Tax=Lichenibacterium dinghuense TaxID=2895977 RepID=UPI001F2F2F42|nr:N-acetylmuramoyl-L-alanine amidase [Lichenibacterium sp. 6Y81]